MFPQGSPDRSHCLDVFPFFWKAGEQDCSDCAILLEIWDSGGLVQLDQSVPIGCMASLSIEGEQIPAHVTQCESDEFGFMITLEIERAKWFPARYQPSYLLPNPRPADLSIAS